ncbi:hypothetical protein CYMTET_8798 [Cymbomonas tetramitiformis]|uniref:VCBS repeat-containing protein n=1 Tax=Cymbomonas tetramitiformis TaxID=36881 RepID=A0AAE0GSR7_9CHLO|nr:hypothetical protein CYMTET_8798 [Cymbomonas tetramitiformis]
MDVLSASYDDGKIAWYANDASGSFGSQQVISTLADGASSVYAADVDGDGAIDLLSASAADDKIAWYLNVRSAAPTVSPTTVSPTTNAPSTTSPTMPPTGSPTTESPTTGMHIG